MAKPVVIVVGADKGGVGKTTVSRTLLDYFSANNVPTRAFDTESPRGTLMRFHPGITEIVDMTTTSDQMKIFDTLNAASPSVTVIDVRAGLLSPALASLRDIGFLDAAKSGQITFAVFHILGPSIASLDEIAETANFMQGAKYFLVKNFINDTQFFQWDQATYNSYFHRIKDAIRPHQADRSGRRRQIGRARRRKIIVRRPGMGLDWAKISPDIAERCPRRPSTSSARPARSSARR